jgi:hypothetical protein
MAKVKIQGHASGTGVLTVTAPNTSTDRTITLPDATGTLATTADNGSQLDHSGSKKIEATSTGASVTGVGKFFLENNGGAGGGIVASNTDASNPATGGFLDLMERDVNFGTANNYGVRLYYDGSANKFHIQGGNETTVATHLTMVRDSGEVTIDTGDLIFGTAGKGIVLGSTSNVDANTLDDYEEGTWTPSLSDSGNRSGTWSNTIGIYTKIGNIVHLYFGITGSNMYFTSERGYQYITGIPFNAANPTHYNTYSGTWSGDAVDKSAGGHVYLNGSGIYMHSANSNPSTVGVSGIGCHIAYRTNS